MRIGVLWDKAPGAVYRAIEPSNAMAARGHEIVIGETDGVFDLEALATCDVVHVYRYLDATIQEVARRLAAAGVAFTWDNDDDFSAFPEDSPLVEEHGAAGMARKFASSIETAKMAQVATFTTEALAQRYRSANVGRVEVVPNAAITMRRPTRRPHEGLVIGWIAGVEHRSDPSRLQLRESLQRLLDTYPNVRVECIGVDLGLEGQYRHTKGERFIDLPTRMAGFDIGIAPLADTPFNRARSDIKVKEYAASGAAWLASPLTPYLGLGPEQGGELVADHDWFSALELLVQDEDRRQALARNAAAWAMTQRIGSTADRWERVFKTAIIAAGGGFDRLGPEQPQGQLDPSRLGGGAIAARTGLTVGPSGAPIVRIPGKK